MKWKGNMSTKDIIEALRPAFIGFYSEDGKVYTEILKNGPTVKQIEIAREINRTQAQVNKIIDALSHQGFILERARVGKRSEYFLINPKMLRYVGYLKLEKLYPEFIERSSIEEFIGKKQTIMDELEGLWKKNRVGLGEKKESDAFDIYGWRGEVTLANVCGWIETFKDELKTKDNEMMFFTPNLHLLQGVFLQLMNNVLTGLNCKCIFFVKPENLETFGSIRESLVKGPIYEAYAIPSYVFIDHLRVVVLGDVLALICLKRTDNYAGTLFYRCVEEIKNIRKCLHELKQARKKI
jgi:predicted transcriptional regulator